MFDPFVLKARAKVNLALHVLGRRADGYHELDSIVAFADVGDLLRFSPSADFAITTDGPFAADVPAAADNILAKAWDLACRMAERRGARMPGVTVHLTKNLPVASGIGGGSADAAEALRGFLRVSGFGDPDDDVMAAALELGADVPVCLAGKACRMQGVGERITPLQTFSPVQAVLVNPGLAVSTPAVFGALGLERGQAWGSPIDDCVDFSLWRNDLAVPAIGLSPVIADVIAYLQQQAGITRVFMSGSGATCVGLSRDPIGELPFPANWWAVHTVLR